MDVKYAQTESQVSLLMACGDNCGATIPLADYAQSSTQWQTVTIPTQCFSKKGMNFAEVFTVLELKAGADTQLTVSDIRLVPNAKDLPECVH